MTCKCGSRRIANICGKSNDMNSVNVNTGSGEHQGYVPRDLGIGGGDYIRFSWCLDCGQIQGQWPLGATEIEADEGKSDADDGDWICPDKNCRTQNTGVDDQWCWKCGGDKS